ncbi:hypothetical protein RJ641_026136 [Dillenia turbinata]|uniref:Uncharacterized protein n=1 Tax=Dillenia turbinata TaxID=194707 RepID=A0AAN8W8D0_9MAGN
MGASFSSMNIEVVSNVELVLEGKRYPVPKPCLQMVIKPDYESKYYLPLDAFDSRHNPDRPVVLTVYPKGVTSEEAKIHMLASEMRDCAKIVFTYENGKITVEKFPRNVLGRTRMFPSMKGHWKKVKGFVIEKGLIMGDEVKKPLNLSEK